MKGVGMANQGKSDIQCAAVAPMPLTTHPLVWAEPHYSQLTCAIDIIDGIICARLISKNECNRKSETAVVVNNNMCPCPYIVFVPKGAIYKSIKK